MRQQGNLEFFCLLIAPGVVLACSSVNSRTSDS